MSTLTDSEREAMRADQSRILAEPPVSATEAAWIAGRNHERQQARELLREAYETVRERAIVAHAGTHSKLADHLTECPRASCRDVVDLLTRIQSYLEADNG